MSFTIIHNYSKFCLKHKPELFTEDWNLTELRWRSLGSYGRTTYKIIKKLEKRLESESDHKKTLELARTIGYLTSVQQGLIKEHNITSLEKRIDDLEKRRDSN